MSDGLSDWIAILGVALTTIATRGSFVVFGARVTLSPLVEQALRFAPAAVLGAIVLPALLVRHGQVDLTIGNQRLAAAAVAALVIWRSRSMMLGIGVGMGVLTLARLYG